MIRLTLVICLLSGPGWADATDPGGAHRIQTLYRTAPCTKPVGVLDAGISATQGLQALVVQSADLGMVWGYLLGIEALHPGINGHRETLLMRLREACAATPDVPALQIIEGFIAGLD